MARVTVEDCIDKIPNRFDLVMLAAHRARTIAAGAAITIDRDRDKNPVVALREIADQTLALTDLEDSLIKTYQRRVEPDEPEEEEIIELMGADQPWAQPQDMSAEELEGMSLEGEDGEPIAPEADSPADSASDDTV